MKWIKLFEEFEDDSDVEARYQLFDSPAQIAFYFNNQFIKDTDSIKDLIEKYNEFYLKGGWTGGPPPEKFIDYFNKKYNDPKELPATRKTWYPTIAVIIETPHFGDAIVGFSIRDKSLKLVNWGELGNLNGDENYNAKVKGQIVKFLKKLDKQKLKIDELIQTLNLDVKNPVQWEWKES